MAEWKALSAAEIKKNIAINIDDMGSLALVVVDQSVHLGGILVRIDIVTSEGGLSPGASKVGTSGLGLGEGTVSHHVDDRGLGGLGHALALTLNHTEQGLSNHFLLIIIYN